MTVESTITFETPENTDNIILVAAAFNIQKGQFMSRDDARDIPHNKTKIINHPTISGLIKTGENHLMTKGRIRMIFTLDKDITTEQIQNYITYIESDLINGKAIYVEAANELHVFYTAIYAQETFREFSVKYAPLSTKAKMIFHEGSDLLCCLRIDGEPEAWTTEYRDITNTATIDKKGNLCYVVFSTDVSSGNKSLSRGKAYKLTSDTIDITVSENTKVVRMYRD